MLTVDLTSNTASGAAGRSAEHYGILVKLPGRRRQTGIKQKQESLTGLQVPQVFAAHLVAPAFAESVTATPDIEPGTDGDGAVARPGLGAAGVGVLALGAVALELRLNVLVFLWAKALPAQRVCGRTVNTDLMWKKKKGFSIAFCFL